MSLFAPLTTIAAKRNFIAYDLEWWREDQDNPFTRHEVEDKVRLVGCMGGLTREGEPRGYRSYLTVDEFLQKELTRSNRGAVFVAHSGGKHDWQFIAYRLHAYPDLTATGCAAGSRFVRVAISRRDGKRRCGWTFIDSVSFFPGKLEAVGKAVGLPKLVETSTETRDMSALKKYNERDCEIVLAAMAKVESIAEKFGGGVKSTIPSTSMSIVRTSFLKAPIKTSMALNRLVQPAYCASRVEPYREWLENAHGYDITSSFPHSMLSPLPANRKCTLRGKLPTNEDALYVADVDVNVPEMYLPPLFYRANDKVYFPTGKWRGWFDKADIDLLYEAGGKVDKVHRTEVFEPFLDLAEYVRVMFSEKEACACKCGAACKACAVKEHALCNKGCRAGIERDIFKLFLNGNYGKYGERPEKEKVVWNPESLDCPRHKCACTDCKACDAAAHGDCPIGCPAGCDCVFEMVPGVIRVKTVSVLPHAHYPIAIAITARSRAALWRYNMQALRSGGIIGYSDTDSVKTTSMLPTSAALGDLKYEGEIRRARFLAPKLYWIEYADGRVEARAKGVSQATREKIDELAHGGTVSTVRMATFKESLRLGREQPGDIEIEKELRTQSPKRAKDGDDSRPWRISEIEAA